MAHAFVGFADHLRHRAGYCRLAAAFAGLTPASLKVPSLRGATRRSNPCVGAFRRLGLASMLSQRRLRPTCDPHLYEAKDVGDPDNFNGALEQRLLRPTASQ
jgi:hypothetical protein